MGQLRWSNDTADKLTTKHYLDVEDVRAAVEGVQGLEYSVHVHPTKGRRALVKVQLEGIDTLVVLYPDRQGRLDVWHLGSAYAI